MNVASFASIILGVVALGAIANASPAISAGLKKAFEKQATADLMIIMKAKTSDVLAAVESQVFVNTDSKATTLHRELNEFTSASQREVLEILSQFKSAKVRGFYITNRVSVYGATAEVVKALQDRDDIEEIREAKVLSIGAVIQSDVKALEWGVAKINSPKAWENGFTGEGVIVSNIDTGVRYTHNALNSAYRPEYGWFDPYLGTALPNDQNGHGTHTMGTICGRDGTGVAQASHWIACKGCSTSECTEDALIGCGQWTFCPTRHDGSGSNCTMRPHLSSNSWGGGNEDPFYDEVINMWNSVNIIPVFAIGNSGPGCRTANSPGDRPGTISVGATNNADAVASFSSHGPTLNSNVIKPDVSAPGVNVRSSSNLGDNAYAFLSGTSMACPHTAGAVALLIQAGHTNRTTILEALTTTTVRPELGTIVCTGGGVNITYPWPNNSFGWGRIDVANALGIKN